MDHRRSKKLGFLGRQVGTARAQTFYRYFAGPILMPLPNGVFRSWSWSDPPRAWFRACDRFSGAPWRTCAPVQSQGRSTSPESNVLGGSAGGLALTAACFPVAAALVGIFAVALMRAEFEFTLGFARNERRGGIHPIIEHQAVGYALADAKMAIEATRACAGGVPGGGCAIAWRAGIGDRGKSPWFGNGRAGVDGSHACRRDRRATITVSR